MQGLDLLHSALRLRTKWVAMSNVNCFRRLEIDDQFELGRLHDRQISALGASGQHEASSISNCLPN